MGQSEGSRNSTRVGAESATADPNGSIFREEPRSRIRRVSEQGAHPSGSCSPAGIRTDGFCSGTRVPPAYVPSVPTAVVHPLCRLPPPLLVRRSYLPPLWQLPQPPPLRFKWNTPTRGRGEQDERTAGYRIRSVDGSESRFSTSTPCFPSSTFFFCSTGLVVVYIY